MTTLMIEVEGEMVPLTDVNWLLRQPCGCLQAVSLAANGDDVYAASEPQAWGEFYDTKKEISKAQREGYKIEVITKEGWKKISGQLTSECGHVDV